MTVGVLRSATPMLYTADMKGTILFYSQVLGFRLCSWHPDLEKPVWCHLERDGVPIMFYAHIQEPGGPAMTGRLYIRTDDVMAIHSQIKDRVNVFEGPEVRFYQMKEFAIWDNNGYALVFAQETDEPPTCREE